MGSLNALARALTQYRMLGLLVYALRSSACKKSNRRCDCDCDLAASLLAYKSGFVSSRAAAKALSVNEPRLTCQILPGRLTNVTPASVIPC